MGLIDKTADLIHRQQGWFTSDSFTNAPVGSWGVKNGHLFQRMGDLKAVNKGVPDPVLTTIVRTPRWFTDSGVTVGKWNIKSGVPGGLASLSVTLTFDSNSAVACFLGEYIEVQTRNLDAVGDALVDLYHQPGKDWKLTNKWVSTALQVTSGFIVMSRDRNTRVTLSGQGTLNADGVPIQIKVDGFVNSASSSVEMVGLDNITPFCALCEVRDPVFAKADWHPLD